MAISQNPNVLRSSNILLVSAILGSVNAIFYGGSQSFYGYFIAFITIAFLLVLAFLIRQGFKWVTWVFMALFVVGIIPMIQVLPLVFEQSIIEGCISVLQNLAQLAAAVLLLLPYKLPDEGFKVY